VEKLPNFYKVVDCAMVDVIVCQPVTVEAKIQPLARSCGICGGQSGPVTGVILCTSVFPCQYHSGNAPYSFSHLSPKLYTVYSRI
jgi:hypothetical protein